MQEINQHLHVQAVTFATHHPEELAGFYNEKSCRTGVAAFFKNLMKYFT
jgi:hypothetical protein